MLAEVACLKVLLEFDLPPANIVMASGGKFYILLPNLADVSDRLVRLREEADQWLLARFHGALALNLAWTPISDEDFGTGEMGGGFPAALSRLHGELAQRKQRRLEGALADSEGWREEAFLREGFSAGASLCPACRRFPGVKTVHRGEEEEALVCPSCYDDWDLGRHLPPAQFVGLYDRGGCGSDALGWSFAVASTLRELPSSPVMTVRLNAQDLSEQAAAPATYRFVANHVPTDGRGIPLSFDELAGNGLLGVLKADVDYLG